MFALYLVVYMGGVSCEAVAVCDEDQPSCDAVVLECEAPVRLSACLNEASAFTPDEVAQGLDEVLDPIYGLGCSTDMAQGWPSVVVFDRDELELAK